MQFGIVPCARRPFYTYCDYYTNSVEDIIKAMGIIFTANIIYFTTGI